VADPTQPEHKKINPTRPASKFFDPDPSLRQPIKKAGGIHPKLDPRIISKEIFCSFYFVHIFLFKVPDSKFLIFDFGIIYN